FLSDGLEQTFLAAADCDTVVNEECQGDGVPDFTLSEIQRRFDHATNSGVSDEERWNLPNVLSVRTFTYAHTDEALVDMVAVQNPAILADAFGSGATSPHPTLMTLTTQRSRSVNLDAALNPANTQAIWTDNTLSLNLNGQALIEQAGVTWTPYAYIGGAWQAMRLSDYWDVLGARYAADFSDEPDPFVAEGELNYVRLYYLAIAQGVSRVVQVNNVKLPVSFVNPKTPFVFKLVSLTRTGTKFLLSKAIGLLEQGIAPERTMKYLGQLSLESVGSLPIVGGTIKTIFQSEANALNMAKRGAVIGAAVIIGIGIGLSIITYAIASQFKSDAAKVITQVGETAYTPVVIGMALKNHLKIVKSLGAMLWAGNGSLEPLTKCLTSLSDSVRMGAVGELIGLVIEIGIIWGTFVYAALSGQLEPDTIATSQFVANAIAQTILAILFFALSLTLVGSLLVGIIKAIDAMLGLLCNSFGVDSACFTLSGYAAQVISGNFFGVTPTVNLQMSDIGVVRHVELLHENAAHGLVEGAQVRVRATFYTRLLQDLSGSPSDMARQAYHAGELFTPWRLQHATVRYGLNYSPTLAAAGDMVWQWTTNVYDTITAYVPREFSAGQDAIVIDLYQGEAEETLTSAPITLHAGRNMPVKGLVNVTYALPAAECWGERSVSTCKPRSLDGYVNPPIDAELLVLDVFPATLDGLYTFLRSSGFTQKDYDNDGLIAREYGGLDPDDMQWDMDGDGVSDGVEMAQRAQGKGMLFDNPLTGHDTDEDGLSDAEELWRGTNPASADTDRDGLTDKEELDGWLWAYSADGTLQTIVTSDPTNPDTDGDGNNDQLERDLYQLDPLVYPFHPRRPDPVYATLGVSISDDDGFLGGGQAFTYTINVGNTTPISHPLNFAGTVENDLLNLGSDSIFLTPLVNEFAGLTRDATVQFQAQGQVRWTSGMNRTSGIATTAIANFYEPSSSAILNWVDVADVTWTPDAGYNPLHAAIAAPNNWDDPFVVAALRTGLPANPVDYYRVGASAFALGSTLSAYTDSALLATPPVVVCAPNEAYCLTLWSEKTDAGAPSYALRGQVLAFNGQSYNDYFTVADDPTCDETEPAAASDGHDFMLTWRCGGGVYARSLAVSVMGGFAPVVALGSTTTALDAAAPNAAAADAKPSVAWTGNRYTVAWEKESAPANRDVYAVQVDADANVLGAGVAVAASLDDTRAPQIAYAPAGDAALIVYRTGTNVWGARLAGTQAGLSAATTALLGSGSAATFNPKVAYDPRMDVWQVAWITQSGGLSTANFRAVNSDGTLYGALGSHTYGGLSIDGSATALACSAFDCAFTARSDWSAAPAERNYYVHRYSLRATYPYLGAATLTRGVTFTVEFDQPAWVSFSGLPESGADYYKGGQTTIIGGVVNDATSGIDRVEASLAGAPLSVQGKETWLASLTVPEIEGTYPVVITATDKADNARTTAFIVIADSTPPALTSVLADNTALRVATNTAGRYVIPLSGSVADPRVTFTYPPDNTALRVEVNVEPNGRGWQPAIVTGTTWALDYALSALDAEGAVIADPTGYYTVTLRAADGAGNVTASADYLTLHLYVDNDAPRVTLHTPDPGGVVAYGNVISITKGVTLITQTDTLAGSVTEAQLTESGVLSAGVRLQPVDATMWPGLWSGAYRNSGAVAPLFTRADADTTGGGLSFDWGAAAPDSRLDADDFTVEWQRLTAFSVGGAYTFTITKDADSTAQLLLDGNV
ncbi:MAG: hypothetical protein JXO22_07320, partial [Phycisphaerae bacterium]|nr:hypothetical protein [Phycisphaerae bacterium]